ncbi:MAG: NAD(P)/FAD-dependent oxidoreductase, partial [Nocardioidaceae bacterium]
MSRPTGPGEHGSDARSADFVNGDVSFWYRGPGLPPVRPPLPGPTTTDVCVVGAGLTGLWTAYYLKSARPDLDVVVVEQEFAGFGASGRNGGWLTAALPGDAERYAATHGPEGVVAMQSQMFGAVDEVISVARREGIDASIVKGGEIDVATNAAQEERLRQRVDAARRWGWREDDLVLLDRAGLDDRLRVDGARAGSWTPHCARIQPARLVRGLADAVERLGVRVFERTRVTGIRPGAAVTDRGTVTADHVVRATEGFTAQLAGERRTWLPMNSSMVVTEPLTSATWERIGWQGYETLGDGAHAYVYAQRTADDRIAIGGRGVPYRFASRGDDRGRTQESTVRALHRILCRLFPVVTDARIDHAWSGV